MDERGSADSEGSQPSYIQKLKHERRSEQRQRGTDLYNRLAYPGGAGAALAAVVLFLAQQWETIDREDMLGGFPLGEVGWWVIGVVIVAIAVTLGIGILMIVIASWAPGYLEMPTITEIDDYYSKMVRKYEEMPGSGSPEERAEHDLKEWHDEQAMNCTTAQELVNDRRQEYIARSLHALGVTAVEIGFAIVLIVGYNLIKPAKPSDSGHAARTFQAPPLGAAGVTK